MKAPRGTKRVLLVGCLSLALVVVVVVLGLILLGSS